MIKLPPLPPPPPKWIIRALVVLVVLSWLPFVVIARARTVRSEEPRIHILQDMDNQPKLKSQQRSVVFADSRTMRPHVEGTVARGALRDDDAYYRGRVADAWVEEFPIEVRRETVQRGRERFGIYCAPCHGADGSGQGPVSLRAIQTFEPTWVQPTSLHNDDVVGRPVGHLFNTITNGIRTMPSYRVQIPPADRWAIVAYLRALQLSQRVNAADLPKDVLDAIR